MEGIEGVLEATEAAMSFDGTTFAEAWVTYLKSMSEERRLVLELFLKMMILRKENEKANTYMFYVFYACIIYNVFSSDMHIRWDTILLSWEWNVD